MIITGDEISKYRVDEIQSSLQGKVGREKMDIEFSYTKHYIKSDMPKIYSDKYGDLFKIFLAFSKPNLTQKEKNFEKVFIFFLCKKSNLISFKNKKLVQKLQKQLAELDEQEKKMAKRDEETFLDSIPEPPQQQLLQQQFFKSPWQNSPWSN